MFFVILLSFRNTFESLIKLKNAVWKESPLARSTTVLSVFHSGSVFNSIEIVLFRDCLFGSRVLVLQF